MTLDDDKDLEDRFARRMAALDDAIPEPPPMHSLRAARPSITSRGGAGSHGSWSAAVAAVAVVGVAIAGGAFILRLEPATPGASQLANAASPSVSAAPSVVEASPYTSPLAVDQAIGAFDLRAVVQGLPGGGRCAVDVITDATGYGTFGTSRSWDTSRVSLVACPHTAGDSTFAQDLNGPLQDALIRLGAMPGGGAGQIDATRTAPVPVVLSWHFLTDDGVGALWVIVADASGPQLRILVTLDLTVRNASG